MSFEVAADAYDRFMGRYSAQLSSGLADLAGVQSGQTAIDVGCGPGALTRELVERLGPAAVAAVDPSEPFVAAARSRHPGVDVRLSTAEDLPYADGTFDTALAQLVVHFMTDPVGGIAEMARVTRADGAVVACVWDLAGGRAPISPFWRAARDLDGAAEDESDLPGARAHHLTELFVSAGLREVEETELSASVEYASFDEWWEPYTLGVGPAGAHARSLGDTELSALRERCRQLLPEAPFTLNAVAWATRGLA
ncbi:MAG: methyltransferase domain-containing protein [Actinomycetota bacterium]|nr:methyltransferase domain-containing protein [Actinomycetota bacterium]